jgi:hypothetical protein
VPSPSPQSERRRRIRVRADFSVALKVGANSTDAQAKDISELGLACTSDTKLAMRAKVQIELALPGKPAAHQIDGHVIRCAAVDATGREYNVAIAFTAMTPICRAAIFGYVQKGKRVR